MKAGDGAYHVLVSVSSSNAMMPGLVTYETGHRASTDGVEFSDQEGLDFAGDADPANAQAAPVLRGITSEPSGALLLARRDALVRWSRDSQTSASLPLGEIGALPGWPSMLAKASAGSWDSADYWVVSPEGAGHGALLLGLGLASGSTLDHAYSTQAYAIGADGRVQGLFFDTGRLQGEPAELPASCWPEPDLGTTSCGRGDRQHVLYRISRENPRASAELETVALSSLAPLRDGFGRDHIANDLAVLGAGIEADGTLVGVFSLGERLPFFAAIVEGAEGPRLSEPTFLDGEFFALAAFPDSSQPVVFMKAAGEQLLALPVTEHSVGEVYAVDGGRPLAEAFDSIHAAALVTEPDRRIALLVPRPAGAGVRLDFLRAGLRRLGSLLSGELEADTSGPEGITPASVAMTAPAGADSYEWCPADDEPCREGPREQTLSLGIEGAQAMPLVVVRAVSEEASLRSSRDGSTSCPGATAATSKASPASSCPPSFRSAPTTASGCSPST